MSVTVQQSTKVSNAKWPSPSCMVSQLQILKCVNLPKKENETSW